MIQAASNLADRQEPQGVVQSETKESRSGKLHWASADWLKTVCFPYTEGREVLESGQVLSRQATTGWPRSSFAGRAEHRNLVKFLFADAGFSMSGFIWPNLVTLVSLRSNQPSCLHLGLRL